MKFFLLIGLLLLPFCALHAKRQVPSTLEPPTYFQGTNYEYSANCTLPGEVYLGSFFWFTDFYADYNDHWSAENSPNLWEMIQLFEFETGITQWMDLVIQIQGIYNQQSNASSYGFGDCLLSFGFQILRLDLENRIPNLRFFAGEIFPTGEYSELSPNRLGTDAFGTGAYSTTLGLVYQQLFLVSQKELYLTLGTNYILSAPTAVREFNAYGGNTDTRAKVKPGDLSTTVLTLQLGLTQNWIIANDLFYIYQKKTSSIDPTLCTPPSHLIGIAPQIEYGISDHYGIIFGGGASIAGKNTEAFAQVLLAINALF